MSTTWRMVVASASCLVAGVVYAPAAAMAADAEPPTPPSKVQVLAVAPAP